MPKIVRKTLMFFTVIIMLYTGIQIISIVQETYRDSKSVNIPLIEKQQIFQTDVSDMNEEDVLEIMIGDMFKEDNNDEEKSEEP